MRFRLPTLPKKPRLKPRQGADLRPLGPLHTCSCGCTVFNVMCSFEDYEIVWWFLDAECADCGNILTVPCPVDKPE